MTDTKTQTNRPPLPYHVRQSLPWSKEPVPWGWWIGGAERSARPAVIPLVRRTSAPPIPVANPVTSRPANQTAQATACVALMPEERAATVVHVASPAAAPRLGKLGAREKFSGQYLVRRADQGTRRDGRPFWKLLLGDESGWLQCFVWPEIQGADTPIVEGMHLFIEAHTRLFGDRLVADIEAFSVDD